MGYLTLGILGFTAIALFFGAIFGAGRGSNRAFLRLILVVASVAVAFFIRETVVEVIMNLETGEGTLYESLTASLVADSELPTEIVNLVLALVEIIFGLVAFYVSFFVLRFVSWLIIYPICKIFVKKGNKPHRFFGFIFGLLQGVVIAFIICAPITGMVTQLNKLSNLEIEGQKVIEIPEEIGVEDYVKSMPYEIYTSAGTWFFDALTTTVDEDGNKITINDTVDVVSTFSGIANSMEKVDDSINVMTSETATPQEQVNAMKDFGNTLIEIGNSIDNLTEDAKNTVNNVISSVKDMITSDGEELPEDVAEMLDNFDIDDLDFKSVGEAMNGIATYIEKTSDEFDLDEEVTATEVNAIVNGIANNDFIFSLMTSGDEVPTILEIKHDADKTLFSDAINNTTLSDSDKDNLRSLFGLI